MTSKDKFFMNLALQEAYRGGIAVYPNPRVGAVIVSDGKVVSSGYHKTFGSSHAEFNALNNIDKNISNATLYVTLEPCKHHGKTGPCIDLIDPKIINRVVIGSRDPNQIASGGLELLKQKNIDVEIDICADEARQLNRRFFTFYEDKRPYIILKIASTMDGFIAEDNGHSKWITNVDSRDSVHELRSSCDAILVGRKTIEEDDPSLTSHGKGKDPKIIIIDKQNKIKKNANVFKNDPIIFSGDGLTDDPHVNIKYILDTLFQKNIQSLMVEGGGITFSHFIDSKFFDELHVYYAPKLIGSGLPLYHGKRSLVEDLGLKIHKIQRFKDNIKIIYYKN